MRLLLISSILVACLSVTSATLEVQPESNKASTFEIVQDFRTPKNIMFSCMYGGSSHMSWVLSILHELSNRGHSLHFLTRVNICFHLKKKAFYLIRLLSRMIMYVFQQIIHISRLNLLDLFIKRKKKESF